MGQLLFFKCSQQRPAQPFAPHHSAEILFFTGVRYVPFMGDISEAPPKTRALMGGSPKRV
jgi:hypothetical protein